VGDYIEITLDIPNLELRLTNLSNGQTDDMEIAPGEYHFCVNLSSGENEMTLISKLEAKTIDFCM
jgi:hypothetical protein